MISREANRSREVIENRVDVVTDRDHVAVQIAEALTLPRDELEKVSFQGDTRLMIIERLGQGDLEHLVMRGAHVTARLQYDDFGARKALKKLEGKIQCGDVRLTDDGKYENPGA
jgi:hypothetical protein